MTEQILAALQDPQALAALGFANRESAARALSRIAAAHPADFLAFAPQLFTALAQAGSPDRVLATLERFLQAGKDSAARYAYLAGQPRAVEMLVRIFSGSQFLAEILLRSPEYLEHLLNTRQLARPKTPDRLLAEARTIVALYEQPGQAMDGLRHFQRLELLRIGACDLLDLFDLTTATAQLSLLAGALVQACLELAAKQVGADPSGLAVIGMGKLGGQELNYSSDIDLLLLAAEDCPHATRMGEKLIDAIGRVTIEGFLYRVDMRLRPWGRVGPLTSTPAAFLTYLQKNALLWEKQALLKARVVAGNRALGEDFLTRARPLIFGAPEETVRADVFAMKARTEALLQQKGRAWGDVKLGEGSIRDVEFVVQALQLIHGAEKPETLSPNTLDALPRLRAATLISAADLRILTDGYIFLRTVEHHLQMLDYRQTHTLPEDEDAIRSLARRLGYEGSDSGDQFIRRYRQHAAAIRAVYLRQVGRIEMTKDQPTPEPANPPQGEGVNRHRERMDASYAERFTAEEIARHAALADLLDDRRLAAVEAQPRPGGSWQVTIVAHDYPGAFSLFCGLLYIYGLDITGGDAFTYETDVSKPRPKPGFGRGLETSTRKLVDVFIVRPVRGKVEEGAWVKLEEELNSLLALVRAGQRREARGEMARRVGTAMFEAVAKNGTPDAAPGLLPLEIEIDNDSDPAYTLLRIDTQDTVGFLYEFTNALAIERIYIARVSVRSVGDRAVDTLYVTGEDGQKITRPERQRELRAATVLVKNFTHLLPLSPNPESALLHFREFLAQLFQRPDWIDELGNLERPEVLHALARLLGVSDFLWDDFLRMQYENLYPVVTDVDALATAKTRAQLQAELEAILKEAHPRPAPPAEDAPWREALNAFKDREMFRIDMRHILGHTKEFWDFAAELTDLTEVVVNAVYHLCHEDLRCVYGAPMLESGTPSEMVVCALGKFGGAEMGFASDIELMFVYAGNGRTTGPHAITTAEFYEKLVQEFVRVVRARREGVFEVDLQLRPYGKAGSLAVSLDSFRRYFAPGGPAWAYERQALVRLRPVAGNPGLGKTVAALRDSYVYTGEKFDVTAMRAMRERQIRHLVGGGTLNLKYSPGGLVDVEYLIQGLQITHGHAHPEVRGPNTREALAALAKVGIFSKDDATRLRKAHTFLRWLIDSLRVVRGNAKDVTIPPADTESFGYLTRRMQYGNDRARLSEEINRYTTDVVEINRRAFG